MDKIQDGLKAIIQECNIKHDDVDDFAKKSAGKIMQQLSGYFTDIPAIFANKITNSAGYTNNIDFLNIPFLSYCYHHMSPIIGHVNVSYKPDQWIIGLSKIMECVYAYTQRLQLQENLTIEIAQTIIENLSAKSVRVEIYAKHYCMQKTPGQILPDIRTEHVIDNDKILCAS